MRRLIILLISGLIVLGGMFSKSFIGNKNSQPKSSDKTVTLVRIIDGDTYEVIYNGKKEKVRLIGIDTPESKANKKAYKDSKRSKEDIKTIVKEGLKAKDFVKSLIKKDDVLKIEFDVRERDQYGRLLAYLYLPNGKMLNNVIIEEGYAAPLTYPPNVKYVELFRNSYIKARENKKGLWGD